jgi:hypothetical protein
LTWLADEGVSGAVPPESRKRFKAALALLEAGESEALIWRLIVTEMGIDTRTPMGKAMAHMADEAGIRGRYQQESLSGISILKRAARKQAVAEAMQPHFKRSEDQLTAYAWVVELAEGSRHLLYEFAQRYELGYFAQRPDDLDARDGQP